MMNLDGSEKVSRRLAFRTESGKTQFTRTLQLVPAVAECSLNLGWPLKWIELAITHIRFPVRSAIERDQRGFDMSPNSVSISVSACIPGSLPAKPNTYAKASAVDSQ